MRRHSRMEIRARKTYENQGIQADLVIRASAPANRSEEEKWTAAGKPIGRVRSFFDGTARRPGNHVRPGRDVYRRRARAECAASPLSHAILDVRKLYSQVAVDRQETLAGEDSFRAQAHPEERASRLTVRVRANIADPEGADRGRNRPSSAIIATSTARSCRSGRRFTMRWVKRRSKSQDVKFNVDLPPGSFAP